MRIQWIAIHSNGIHTYSIWNGRRQWIGLVCNGFQCIGYQSISIPGPEPRPDNPSGERDKRIPGCGFTTITVTPQITRR